MPIIAATLESGLDLLVLVGILMSLVSSWLSGSDQLAGATLVAVGLAWALSTEGFLLAVSVRKGKDQKR